MVIFPYFVKPQIGTRCDNYDYIGVEWRFGVSNNRIGQSTQGFRRKGGSYNKYKIRDVHDYTATYSGLQSQVLGSVQAILVSDNRIIIGYKEKEYIDIC